MKFVEKTVSAGNTEIFEFAEFMARPLFAHLAHASSAGPCESPVWFHWDGEVVWIIGGSTFIENLKRNPHCALGIVDWDIRSGRLHHVGIRGQADVLPFDESIARAIFRRYFGPHEDRWDPRFDDVFNGDRTPEMVRVMPETIVVRDQSYTPTMIAE